MTKKQKQVKTDFLKVPNTIFILNPISGVNKKKNIPKLIGKYYSKEYEIVFTKYAGHGTELAKKAVLEGVPNIVAVGGDGTINEVAKSLVYTNSSLGIIPTGSGNGLARHLNIPLNLKKAIQFLDKAKPNKIDTGRLNEYLFLCTCGLGLDADVTHDFAKRGTRGLKTYIQSGLSLFRNIMDKEVAFSLDKGSEIKTCGIVFTIANASQYGNNAIISPLSSVNDGKFELCVLPKMRFLDTIIHLIKVFRGTLNQSKKAKYYSFKTLNISNNTEQFLHVDGEPILVNEDIEIRVSPLSLSVLL